MQNFRNLKVWEKAHQLTLHIYASTKPFPKEELYGITSQMRRSSASIGMNIAEGCCKKGDAEMGRFLQIAIGSASELEFQLLLARDLHYFMQPRVRTARYASSRSQEDAYLIDPSGQRQETDS